MIVTVCYVVLGALTGLAADPTVVWWTGDASTDLSADANWEGGKRPTQASEAMGFKAQPSADYTLTLTDVELSIVIGNLLDNAVEACRAAAGRRFIRLSIRMKGGMMYFYLLNSAGAKQKKVGSLFRTGKSGAHGFGLHRAEAILKKHGGWVKYNSEDGAFTSEFLVPAVR